MIHYLSFFCILLTGLTCFREGETDARLDRIMRLPDALNECSGMASLEDGLFVANNDSGNPSELYVFNLNNRSEVKTISIENAKNNDWEELAEDATYVYIGDFGNNSGKRKRLHIYRVKKSDLRDKKKIKADLIEFFYPEQTNAAESRQTNFDCESMVAIGDSLYLFTKNHGNLHTNLYSLPKQPGRYAAHLLGSIDAGGLVTSADYRSTDQGSELILLGYTNKAYGYHPFILYFNNFSIAGFASSNPDRVQFSGRHQLESVIFENKENILVTSEGKSKKDRNVYRISLSVVK